MMIKGTPFQIKKTPRLTPIKNPWFIIITGTERKATKTPKRKKSTSLTVANICIATPSEPWNITTQYCIVTLPTAGPVMRLSQPQSQPQAQQSQSHPPPSAAQLARLADKKKEFEAVDALQRASALFLRRLEGLADDCEAMAEAGIGARFFPLIPLSI